MKQIALPLLALISLACFASAATRPRYGGILRVEMQSAPSTLDLPAYSSPADYWDMARVLSLIADNLVRIDAEGRPLPALAVAWQSDSSARHWQFTLQSGVKFHDGTLASPAAIAKILGALHPEWNVRASAGSLNNDSLTAASLTIDTDAPTPSLLAELALPRNLILTRNASKLPVGTRPFRIADFQPGKSLKLASGP